jgi:SAM-dependent methyltransferase
VLLLMRHRDNLAGRVLEIGCGAGRVLGYLVAIGREVHGIDISSRMVEYCRHRYPGARVRVAGLDDLSARTEGKFDAVLALNNVLDVFDDPGRRRALENMRALLAPDGVVLFSSHNLSHVEQLRVPEAKPRPTQRAYELISKAATHQISELPVVVARLPRRVANRRRLKALQRTTGDHAIINDSAHDYGLLHYYIRRDDQERQLRETGLELVDCLDAEGNSVAAGETTVGPWLHYVARPLG